MIVNRLRFHSNPLFTGSFPSAWKTANWVTPKHKGQENKDDKSNYRPISVVSLLSKVLEKHFHQALYSYMRNINLLYILQSGFWRSYSTETALVVWRISWYLIWTKTKSVGSYLWITRRHSTSLTMIYSCPSSRHTLQHLRNWCS